MPGPPVFNPFGPPSAIPFRLSQQAGRGSSPVRLGLFTREILSGRPLQYSTQRLTVDGNESDVWSALFFKREGSDTAERGDLPFRSVWVTAASLTRLQPWASRDYGLRKVMDDWFLGASSTPGNVLERWRPDGLNSWGGWVVRSPLATVGSLTPNHQWANGGTKLQEVLEDWHFGKTAGSPDMHIMYTRVPYPPEKYLRVTFSEGAAVQRPSRKTLRFFVTLEALIRPHKFGNNYMDPVPAVVTVSVNGETEFNATSRRWFFGYETYPDAKTITVFE